MDAPASDMNRYEFRTAPIGPQLRVEVGPSSARVATASGRFRGEVVYAAVTGARWSDEALIKGRSALRARTVTLLTPASRLRFRCGGFSEAAGGENAHARAFVAACTDILDRLDPAVEVELASAPVTRWVAGTIGAVGALLGALLAVAAFGAALGAAWMDALTFAAAGLVLFGLGATMASAYNPLRPAERISASALAAHLRAYGP